MTGTIRWNNPLPLLFVLSVLFFPSVSSASAAPLSLPVSGAEMSSAAVSDIYALIGSSAAYSPADRPLTVFPEKLTYEISWAGIPVGEASLGVPGLVRFDGRPAYHIVSHARSNRFADLFYKVRDLNESWLDAQRLYSLGYAKKLREGHFFRNEWVLYDQPGRKFLAKTIGRDGGFSYHAGTIPFSVQDILSSLYYVRNQKLSPHSRVIIDVNTKQNWPLVVRVLGRQTVTVPAGTFKTILVEPAIRKEGIFIQKGRHLQVWLTDDARKIPVLMRVELFFGHVEAALDGRKML